MPAVIMIIFFTAMVLGVSLLVLNEFMTSSSVTGTQAATAINTTITKLATVPTWIGIIIIVAFAAIVIALVRSGIIGGRGGGL